ncbi:MgtC/SapB family protein [Sulfitobacter sp. F26204]|uniref:MgtC/SapB family protein n=1 Tax=Sulfitobacter sp. F26204 TaxID=2996014 RepID=UPI00225DF4E4|nr:MgtC/SapB family protein [Sulfitobacter sp. F26204]MCX7558568.1 MgtC/SapB family protein [Sulfitobacter sp. F26204]
MIYIFSDINLMLLAATGNMAIALVMGAIIGSERQFRGRMAGLRTNALVSLGAAGFVTFAALFPEDINPTRVAAQVVSGIGFLGAGIIFRDGFNIQGINTAATLWCSAAVGLISGTGHVFYAIALTSLIVFSNLGLRPIVRRLKNAAAENTDTDQVFELTLVCLLEDEKAIRGILVAQLVKRGLTLRQIESHVSRETVEIIGQVDGAEADQAKIEKTIAQIGTEPHVRKARWSVIDEDAVRFRD